MEWDWFAINSIVVEVDCARISIAVAHFEESHSILLGVIFNYKHFKSAFLNIIFWRFRIPNFFVHIVARAELSCFSALGILIFIFIALFLSIFFIIMFESDILAAFHRLDWYIKIEMIVDCGICVNANLFQKVLKVFTAVNIAAIVADFLCADCV